MQSRSEMIPDNELTWVFSDSALLLCSRWRSFLENSHAYYVFTVVHNFTLLLMHTQYSHALLQYNTAEKLCCTAAENLCCTV